MRLLNTHTLEFEEFIGRPAEPYAILSHRWGDEEVSFKEYRKTRETLKDRAGYKKIVEFCWISQQRGLRLSWIDTCCIDKRSSAELSEAINSMYEWYEHSEECYVWLEDYSGNLDDLHNCTWFSRGWTLQEMLAPWRVVFFTAHWEIIEHKIFKRSNPLSKPECPCQRVQSFPLLGPHITPGLVEASGIPEAYLTWKSVYNASVAARMSWASHRTTTRIEDRAYSLLGLFGINMQSLYGEGDSAFRRLQEEIVRTTNDASIFCIRHHKSWRGRSLLARSPEDFSLCRGASKGQIRSSEPYSLTNRGLRLCVPAQSCSFEEDPRIGESVYRIDLRCTISDFSLSPMRYKTLETSVAQHLYLVHVDEYHYRRSKYSADEISQAMRDTKAKWVGVGEKVFFVTI